MKLAKLGDGPEIFHTLQGEGPTVGCPAVFIRTSRCNLHCIWCDTAHTWNFEGSPWPHEKPEKFSKTEVTHDTSPHNAAKRILSYACPRVVITGGEPLLQQDELLEMIHLIRKCSPDTQFEVETNATLIPSREFETAIDQLNLSPKLTNSGVPENRRIVPEALRHFAGSPKAWFKFVVAEATDLDEVQDLLQQFEIPRNRTLLMPEGRTAADLSETAPQLAERCRELDFRFCDRLHIRLWGDRRGV